MVWILSIIYVQLLLWTLPRLDMSWKRNQFHFDVFANASWFQKSVSKLRLKLIENLSFDSSHNTFNMLTENQTKFQMDVKILKADSKFILWLQN